jgi:glucoamylase
LLTSVTDGRVFDRISAVEERYAVPAGKRTFINHTEIFQIDRPISALPAGHTLRIVNRDRFEVVYTFDDWATTLILCSTPIGYAGWFLDISTTAAEKNKVIFTIKWPDRDRQDQWLGRNVDVSITPPQPPPAP